MQDTGKFLIILGLTAAIIGFIMHMGWGPQAFGWFGKLPGDIRIERENYRFYFPITTCIAISIVLTVIVRIFLYFKTH